MKVFYYIENNIADELIECGIKSDTYAGRVITQNGSEVKCILTYLHPADCEKYKDDDFVPIKIKAPLDYSYVAEGALYNKEVYELYEKSIIPVGSYKVGMYRKPECLIKCTLLPNQLERFDKRRDEPVLYESSEQVYLDRVIFMSQENCPYFNELALETYYNLRANEGNYTKVDSGGFLAYINSENNEVVVIKKWR